MFLKIKKPIVKAHGNSNSKTFENYVKKQLNVLKKIFQLK